MSARPSCCWPPRDETAAQDALEKVPHRLRAAAVPCRSAGEPASGRAQCAHRRQRRRRRRGVPDAQVDARGLRQRRHGRMPMGKAGAGMVVRRRRRRLREGASWCSTRPSCTPAIRTTAWSRAPRWPTGRTASASLHVSSQSQSFIAPALAGHDRHSAHRPGGDRRVLRRRLRLEGRRLSAAGAAGAAVEEDQPPGDDARQPRRGVLPRLARDWASRAR